MADQDLARASVEEALGLFASADPAPGGGSAAALAGALGAALVEMLARGTVGKKGYETRARLMEAVAEEAAGARARLLALARKDADAYARVVEAHRLPHATEEETARRKEALGTALKGAIDVPLEVMEACLGVIGFARNAIEHGNPNAASDGMTGAEIARAGLKGAASSVRANLTSLGDEATAKTVRTQLDEMLYMGTNVMTHLESFVNDLWKTG